MANKEEHEAQNKFDKIVSQNISDEMRSSYLDYAMSVITGRALPDVRDGLKPVHRRILYTMHKMGLTSGAKFRKSAAVVGDVLGKYHPHGDTAVYDAMVKLAQTFATRYPLILGQGNFGSVDGDSAAAMRYTEAKMSKIAQEMLADIEKDTVDFRPNYDGTQKEPTVLPSSVPNLLLNGTLGIAVGMATSIPPHNLSEVVDAIITLIDQDEVTNEDLLEIIKGPDFPTGGLLFGKQDIIHAYSTGRGSFTTRGEAEITEEKAGKFIIVITSIPYRVNKSELIIKIAELVKTKKIEGIKDIRDESTDDIRIVIELKTGAFGNKILNQLYKYTDLEQRFSLNMVALVDGVPKTLSLKAILEEFISHRQMVVKRRTLFDLAKAESREHILLGLKKALDHIDEIIQLIKKSKDVATAHAGLMKTFGFSERQATAILEMRLQKLAGLERKKIEDELKEIQALIKKLKEILRSEKNILKVVKDEIIRIKDLYGDERKTRVFSHEVKNISQEDLIPEQESLLVLTAGGYVKRTDPGEYRKQKRGGVGVIDLDTKDEDAVIRLLSCSTHDDLLFFTDKGKVYQIKMYDLPEGKRATKGKSIVNFIQLGEDEHITSILATPKSSKEKTLSLFMCTQGGVTKKVDARSFHDVRRSGLIAINLAKDDSLVSAFFAKEDDQVVIITKQGQSICFDHSEVRQMGRTAAGVRGIKLKSNDVVVSSFALSKNSEDAYIFVVSENGYAKMTPTSEYSAQQRGGSGVKTAQVSEKTGAIVTSSIINASVEELVAMSQKSQAIKIDKKEIPIQGRSTQGVKIMKLRSSDKVASLAHL